MQPCGTEKLLRCLSLPPRDATTCLAVPPIQASQPDDAAEHARQVQAQGWSDQELLLLLEGVELYGDNWADIAEHVGTKSQVTVEAVAALLVPAV